MSNNEQFQQVLKDLQQKNSQRMLSIWLPSLKKGVNFRHLTLNQQKVLIKSSVRENLLKLDFSRNIYGILQENLAEPDVNLDTLTTLDMMCIGLAYRAADISNEYGFYIDDKLHPVDLNNILKKARTIDYTDAIKPHVIQSDGYHVTVSVPSIIVDKQMNDYLFEKYSDIPDDADAIKDMLADVYICEAAKYIQKMDVIAKDDDAESPPVAVDFTGFTPAQRIKLLDQIPLTVLNRLVDVSDKIQDIESELLDVDLDGETATIEINSAFFT